MAGFITEFTSFLTGVTGWMGQLITFVGENPVLFAFVLIALAGSIIGIVRRWLPGRV